MTLGGTPSCSARTMVGVPCMSLPPTMRTSSPFIRWNRAKMSAGMNVETAWPMCRGPDAYGQATATRIFVMEGARKAAGPHKGFADASKGVADGPRQGRSGRRLRLPSGLLPCPDHLRRFPFAAAVRHCDQPARTDPRHADDDEADPEGGGPHRHDSWRAHG